MQIKYNVDWQNKGLEVGSGAFTEEIQVRCTDESEKWMEWEVNQDTEANFCHRSM